MVEFSPSAAFLIILLALPLQLLFSPKTSSDTRFHFYHLHKSITRFIEWISGKTELKEETIKISSEDLKENYFASSTDPRDPRPPHIKYHVGDVVKHRIHGYKGVIIGWDEKAVAPSNWIAEAHKNKLEWAELPNYSIIIDTRDRLIPQVAYVVEENLELHEGSINHPFVNRYFEAFDGKHYTSRPWHKKIYPND